MEKRKRKDYIKGYHKKGLIEKITYNSPCGNGEILEYVKYWEKPKVNVFICCEECNRKYYAKAYGKEDWDLYAKY